MSFRYCFVIALEIFAICSVFCGNILKREPRFIRGTYTSTVHEKHVITSLVPSSCVYVDATLPPCRNVRFLNFPNFRPIAGYDTDDKLAKNEVDTTIQSTPLAWGEYLGIFAPTVTVTNIELETTIVQDPRIVVTFAVRGCKPSTIPDELDRCPEENTPIPIQEILPTSTVSLFQPNTELPEEFEQRTVENESHARSIDMAAAEAFEAMRKINNIEHSFQQTLESSINDEETHETGKATETLTI